MTNKSVTVSVTGVSEWELDEYTMEGDGGHMSNSSILRHKAFEMEAKLESSEWDEDNLPLEVTVSVDGDSEDIEEAVHNAVVDHMREVVCLYDYYKPVDVEYELVG